MTIVPKALKKRPTATQVYNYLGLGLLGLKVFADHSRHPGHDKHNQNCDCFSQCFFCQTQAAKEKVQEVVAKKMASRAEAGF